MGHCNLRSLLLAIIFISSCITWTSSRHHFTHNVHGHRSRHRRQGAGLFLSSSYVIPGGEGSGEWGDWQDPSPCSRTCGGGVASQKRICLKVGSDGRPTCEGGDTKYFSCETQDCPEGSKDFRAEQCSAYDEIAFMGIKYKSVPFIRESHPCELYCKPEGESFYYPRKSIKVIDGTKCGEDTYNVCVDGTCQPVGCDMMLGSSAREDHCRVCRGDGSSCRVNSGILDSQNLTNGYNDLLYIPEGATSIYISEIASSNNYLALRGKNKRYYLNGDFHIDFPQSKVIAGALWFYERNSYGLPSPDRLRCHGPITEGLLLGILLQEKNVGVQYNYSVPNSVAQPSNLKYTWVHDTYGPCSATCGGGFQLRNVTCRTAESLEEVEDRLCNEQNQPVANQTCNAVACPARWELTPWSECSKPCGDDGFRSRQVTCEKITSDGISVLVKDHECMALYGPEKPPTSEDCNQNATCPVWFVGPWQGCDKLCGVGKQLRQVTCYQKNEGKIEVLSDDKCYESRPAREQPCTMRVCEGVDWLVTEWAGCDHCLSKERTRRAICVTESGEPVDASFCSHHQVPALREICDASKLPPCPPMWHASEWGNCSVDCGEGVQNRHVSCIQKKGKVYQEVAAKLCDPALKPNDTKTCFVTSESCQPRWYAGRWSKCSVPCGGGYQQRTVKCLTGDTLTSGRCARDDVPDPGQDCNLNPCDDAATTVSPDEICPAFEEIEDECDTEDTNYEEVGVEEDFRSTLALDDLMFSDSPSTSDWDIEGSTSDSTTNTNIEGSGEYSTEDTMSTETTESTSEGATLIEDELISTGISSSESDGTDLTTESDATTDTKSSSDVSEDTDSTTETSTDESSGSTESSPTGSTDSTTSGSADTKETVTTPSGATDKETTSDVSEGTGSTTELSTDESSASSGSTEESSSTEETDTTPSSPTETTSDVSEDTGSTTELSTEESSVSTGTTDLPTSGSETTSDVSKDTGSTTEPSTDKSSTSAGTETTSDMSKDTGSTTEESTDESSASSESSSTDETGSTPSSPTETETTTDVSDDTDSTTELSTDESSTSSSDSTDNTASTTSDVSKATEITTELSTDGSSTLTSGSTDDKSAATTEVPTTDSSVTTSDDSRSTTELFTAESSTLSSGSTDEKSTEVPTTESSGATTDISEDASTSRSTEVSPTGTTEAPTSELSSTSSDVSQDTGSTTELYTEESTTLSSGSTEVSTTGSTDAPTSESSGTTSGVSEDTGSTTELSTEEATTLLSASSEVSPTGTTEVTTSESTEETTSPGSTETSTIAETVRDTSTTGSTDRSTEGGSTTEGSTTDLSTTSTGFTEATSTPWNPSFLQPSTRATCKPKPPCCTKTKFGCCPDGLTPASGPFDKGCDIFETCKKTHYGCCPDGVTAAKGYRNKGCPPAIPCNQTLFGCCESDNKTAAEGPDQDNCPPACKSSEYGCCRDEETPATGPKKQGCPETTTEPAMVEEDNVTTTAEPDQAKLDCVCNTTEDCCCPDGSPASEGCQGTTSETDQTTELSTETPTEKPEEPPCKSSPYGCCPDNKTPAHGPEFQGCCLQDKFGCCPDNYLPASGAHREGCGCEHSHFGCCPDKRTPALGPNLEGCSCDQLPHGCCPDGHTPASGPDFEGCHCSTYQFGCCMDGVTVAMGQDQQGCQCQYSQFGCCGDEQTAATGPNQAGCDCATSKYGCCIDGKSAATGKNFQGCEEQIVNSQVACGLRNDSGPCTDYAVYFFFDTDYGGCSRFWYGGCEGNGNRFTTKTECEDVCVQPSPKDSCNLPRVAGPCERYQQRWYYDPERQQCSQFIYGGCLGNSNNFATLELCEKQCAPDNTEDQCNQTIDAGPCEGTYPRWGFDSEQGRCTQFTWGGCAGNSNRFVSEAACVYQCATPGKQQPKCNEPQEAGNCTDVQAAWSFSQTENRCVPFYYNGCDGNGNRFSSWESCTQACPSVYEKRTCELPSDRGPCTKYTQQWYYDTAEKRCAMFYYGGCGGNGNRFNTEEECNSQCHKVPFTTPAPPKTRAVCSLAHESGPCGNYTEQWYFDNTYQLCRQFFYGGCEGNQNRFQTREECENLCREPVAVTPPATGADVCFLERVSGSCADYETRWGYDPATGACVSFTYGGCGGNQNNFPTQEHCERTCGGVQDVCQLPMMVGPCDQSIPKYFYDRTIDACSQFAYGGCDGNGNRFDNLEDCESRCRTGVAGPTTRAPTPEPVFTPAPAPTRSEEIPPACRVSNEADELCEQAGEVWYFDAARRACTAYSNAATGYTCRRSGVFFSEEACERTCGAFRNINVCAFTVEQGSCSESIPKYYYDASRGACAPFAYSGCQGGPNRFSTQGECEDVCVFENDPCKRRAKPLPCSDYEIVWFYDESRSECYEYGTCDKSDPTMFKTNESCMGQCLYRVPVVSTTTAAPPQTPPQTPSLEVDVECQRPRSLAPCGDNATVFYYEPAQRACLPAPIGYCGYRNSYGSEEECERRCGAFVGKDPCREPLNVGECDDTIVKYYWKQSSGKCEPYAYSGCGGGANRFSTAEDCLRTCAPGGPDPACLEPVQVGRACEERASRRWYYSEPAAACLAFVYAGCDGGANSFTSPDECARRCKTRPPEDPEIDGNEVLPDCDRFNEECAALVCEFGKQRTRTVDDCERCSCVQVEVDCEPLRQECEALKCEYGIVHTKGVDGCERCTCTSNPCDEKSCSDGERCVATSFRNPITQQMGFSTDCRIVNKPGSCPPEELVLEEQGRCRRDCEDDADCRGVGKCCTHGCSRLCLEPAITTPAPRAPPAPEEPRAPQVNTATEPNVSAAEGGRAIMRCLFHGNPPPKITWRFGEITIDGDIDRYRLHSDGALEIVSLYRNDSGVYICIGENILGVSRQEINLHVLDPVDTEVGISGVENAAVTGELGRSLNIRCLAYGYPPPSIYWYRGRTMLPYSSELYEARGNVLQIRKLDLDTLGNYACQAYNGIGKAALWKITVRAYQTDSSYSHELLVPRENAVEVTPGSPDLPSRPRPTTTTTIAPEIDRPVYTVAVNTSIEEVQLPLATGSDLSLHCDVDGYPVPEVYWTKDGARLSPSDRTHVTEARLTISGLTAEDGGEYGCHARNEYSAHSSTIQISVQGLYVPSHCTDNKFFADCVLIVRSRYCHHQYYSRFCCKSCVEAGQLDPQTVDRMADLWKKK